MTKTKTLRLTFMSSENKKANLTLSKAKEDLTQDQVKDAMRVISAQGVFSKDGVDLYHEPNSAAWVERTVTTIFDDSAAAKAAAGTGKN